eukprot:Pgem_evm3s16872
MMSFKYSLKVDDLQQMSKREIINNLEYAATYGHVKTIENILSFCKGVTNVNFKKAIRNANWCVAIPGISAAAEYGNLSMIKYLMQEINDEYNEYDEYDKEIIFQTIFEICEKAVNC